eukprot:TRINITY_DN4825_c0_g1_i1.p1 TRINITY_DN4825_c0_g1~~TRINITY_DN4825_c0_g1_i1.p1  ORF type:complete len:444 (+),score=89.97 TRINITY_DN4825_c0_g1_i1:47-1378(+)
MADLQNWTESHFATQWNKVLSSLGEPFPAPDASQEAWKHFVLHCSKAPVVLACIGLLMALTILFRSCCCGCCRRNNGARPSSKPSLCLSLLSVVVIFLGCILYWTHAQASGQQSWRQLDKAADDTTSAYHTGEDIRGAGERIQSQLTDLGTLCPTVQPAVQPVKDKVTAISTYMDPYISTMAHISSNLTAVKNNSDDVSTAMRSINMIPLAMVLLCVLAVFMAFCATRSTRGSGKCSNCCLRSMGVLLFVPAVMIVTSVAVVELDVAVVGSSYCMNVDGNTIAFVEHYAGANSEQSQLTRYYITGQGHNPLLDNLTSAQQDLDQVSTLLTSFKPQLQAVCPDFKGYTQLEADLSVANSSFDEAQRLLSPRNIYPYYSTVVDGVCQGTITGFGWLVTFQALAGILCLPALIFVAENFLDKWRAWMGHEDARLPLSSLEVRSVHF